MRLLTKVMTGVSVAALSVLVAGGVKADAATFTVDKHMTGINSGDMVSYDAVKDKKGTLSWNAKAKWDIYYGTTSYVDISNINTAKKDAYITVKTSAGYTVYKIEKDTVKKYTGKVAASALTIEVDKKAVENTAWTNYQYRTALGAWESINGTTFSVAPYEQQGATLYFRNKGAASMNPSPVSDVTITGAPSGLTVNKIAANSFASKEFKVKVPKKANAPAITVDYNTGVVKAKKNTEYRTGTTFSDATTGWADFSANYTMSVAQAGIFQMRTKATEKKAASKIAVYSWKAVTAPTVTANSAAAASGVIITDKLTYASTEVTDKKKATFAIENKTSGENAVTYVLYKTKTDGSADGKAVATIAPGKKVTLKDAKVSDGTELAVQIAGNKKTDTLPSPLSSTKFKVIYNVKAAATN